MKPDTSLPPNLCYTVALDAPGQEVHRRMARLLVTSLLNTGWHGGITVFRNTPAPILAERHSNVTEILIDAGPEQEFYKTVSWKYRVREQLDLSGISKVLFMDCDCLALRSLNHLMMGSWDIYTAEEPGRITEQPFNGYLTEAEMSSLQSKAGINAGTIGVRSSCYREVMAAWEKAAKLEPVRKSRNRDQHSWNRLLLDTSLRQRPFAAGEVQFPFLHRATYLDYRRAALVHAADRSPAEKLSFLYGLWMDAFGTAHLEEFTAPSTGRVQVATP